MSIGSEPLSTTGTELPPRGTADDRLPVFSFRLCLARDTGNSVPMPTAAKPNIVFSIADDLGYGDLGCYGQKTIQTPVLDALASEGIRFTRHYSGSTVCAPSRGALMTGLDSGRT